MHPSCTGEASKPCFNACFPSPLHASQDSHNTTSNDDFGEATCSSLHPHTQFTNHESLPNLQEAYSSFIKAFPRFSITTEIDQIRDQEYKHLNPSNICFDYIGYGLFSYFQQQSSCLATTSIDPSSSSSSPLPYLALEPSFFDISYKSMNLQSQILYGGHESELESRIKERIMAFMNVSEADYTLVFIANEVSAFKLVADSFQFHSNGELLTVYDHDSEALDVMIQSCKKQRVNVLSAEFSWPSLGIEWKRLKKMITSKREKRKGSLFVFPLHSRVTGAPYSYVWMSMAQENGWLVLLDMCALRPKEMETLGMSLFKPDFMVCSFYKVFGENPSGFGCLFVKKTIISALKDSGNATSVGIISLVSTCRQSHLPEEDIANEETEPKIETSHQNETEEVIGASSPSEIMESSMPINKGKNREGMKNQSMEIECRGLDHADSVGLIQISSRTRCLINWLVNALMSLQHPHHENRLSLIRIYGPKINSHRGPSVAFNVFDWKGEKIDPALVQKLADRKNISLRSSYLRNIRFSDKNVEERKWALETRGTENVDKLGLSKKTQQEPGIFVLTATLGFLTNFEDAYRLWAFLSRFLDADFVEKERWRYMALNQKTIEV